MPNDRDAKNTLLNSLSSVSTQRQGPEIYIYLFIFIFFLSIYIFIFIYLINLSLIITCCVFWNGWYVGFRIILVQNYDSDMYTLNSPGTGPGRWHPATSTKINQNLVPVEKSLVWSTLTNLKRKKPSVQIHNIHAVLWKCLCVGNLNHSIQIEQYWNNYTSDVMSPLPQIQKNNMKKPLGKTHRLPGEFLHPLGCSGSFMHAGSWSKCALASDQPLEVLRNWGFCGQVCQTQETFFDLLPDLFFLSRSCLGECRNWIDLCWLMFFTECGNQVIMQFGCPCFSCDSQHSSSPEQFWQISPPD